MKVLHAAGVAAVLALARRRSRAAGPPAPIDPQNWSFQDNLTWSDYKALPGHGLLRPDDPADGEEVEGRARRSPTSPTSRSTISQPAGSTIFGTPTTEANNIPRADVPAFYRDFLNKPQALNHFQTMNRYWMEDSFGKYGVAARRLRAVPAAGRTRTSTS